MDIFGHLDTLAEQPLENSSWSQRRQFLRHALNNSLKHGRGT